MNFRLTKLKVIISIIVIIAWYVLMYYFLSHNVLCEQCYPFDPNNCAPCVRVFHVDIIPEPCDNCPCICNSPTPFSKLIRDLFKLFIPGIIVYIIWSFIQKKEIVNKRGKR